MDDIVDRLRDHQNGGRRAECEEAANQIEALRGMFDSARLALDVIRNALGVPVEPHQSQLERMVEAAQAKRGVVPDGWQLVRSPISADMHVAAAKVLVHADGLHGTPQRVLDALIAAAPAPSFTVPAPAEVPMPAKCDGNHGGPQCADPECWHDPVDDIIDVRMAAKRLVKRALAVGVVLTIETQPRQPLAMGNYDLVVQTREARKGGAA